MMEKYSRQRVVVILLALIFSASGFAFVFSTTGTGGKWSLPDHMRGAVAPVESATTDTIEWMAERGANFVMLNFSKDEKGAWDDPNRAWLGLAPTDDDPLLPYEAQLIRLDKILAGCREHGVSAVVALAKIWGRDKTVFWDPESEEGQMGRDHLVQLCTAMAERYRNEPSLVAFDPYGEPNWQYDQQMHFNEILPSAIAAIRAEDSEVWISIQPGPGIGPEGMDVIEPYDDPRVLYNFHMYTSLAYTHQGIKGHEGVYTYPGMAPWTASPDDQRPAIMWDKEVLREFMLPAINMKKDHDVRILIGEFSVIRFAPGATNYLRDVVELFEEEGFDWGYHSVCGWDGWSLTVDPAETNFAQVYGAPEDLGAPTDRLDIILAGWGMNNTNPVGAEFILAGWDGTGALISDDPADVVAADVSATRLVPLAGDWTTKSEGSDDTTFGSFPGAVTNEGAQNKQAYYTQTTNGAYLDFEITNNGTEDYDLAALHFDVWRKYGASGVPSASVLPGGDITAGGFSVEKPPVLGAPPSSGANYTDVNISLAGLVDHTLAAGESVVFRISVSAGDEGAMASIYIDNIAVGAFGY